MSSKPVPVTQCQKPRGWLGRLTLRRMNVSHSSLTDWGLSQISVQANFTVLDAGCGGGRTIGKLAALATQGKVFGIDYAEDSVAVSRKFNAAAVQAGRVEIRQASVSQLPFSDNTFDLVTAVETHFWWPNLSTDLREVLRVIKPGGQLIVIAEIYKGATHVASRVAEKFATRTGMLLLSADEHRDFLSVAGFRDVTISTISEKGWICATGKKPS
jgi:ubiquinone/menaquinone biosynthesis C-methylase UbiE